MKEHTGNRLKTIMAERKLKQVDILKAAEIYKEKYGVKITKQDLSHYVNGRVEPGQDKLYILAKVLDVSEGWLMGFDVDRRRIPDEERETTGETLTEKITNTVLQLNEQNQQNVYDFAVAKLNKQRETKIIGLTEKTNQNARKVEKEQREIENEIADMMAKHSFAAYGGQDTENMSDEDHELLEAAFRHVVTESRRIAKEKFTPKKHRND